MFPTNPNQLKKMMKQMGIDIEEVPAVEVIIRTRSEDLIFRNPNVTKMCAREIAWGMLEAMNRASLTVENTSDIDDFREDRKMCARGVETFQITGSYEVVERVEIKEEDVELVAEQAGVSREEARKALEEAKGDLAEALMKLQNL